MRYGHYRTARRKGESKVRPQTIWAPYPDLVGRCGTALFIGETLDYRIHQLTCGCRLIDNCPNAKE